MMRRQPGSEQSVSPPGSVSFDYDPRIAASRMGNRRTRGTAPEAILMPTSPDPLLSGASDGEVYGSGKSTSVITPG